MKAEVSQGSTLRRILFQVCINILPNNLSSHPKLYADDTSLFSAVKNHIGNLVLTSMLTSARKVNGHFNRK